jgi:hypothetical protein
VTKGVRETSTSAMLASIKGLTPLEDWVFPGPDGDYLVTAYGVDLEALDFPTSPVYADATTLKALVRLFRAEHAGPEAAALAERLQVFPDDPRGAALIAELKAIGAANGAP